MGIRGGKSFILFISRGRAKYNRCQLPLSRSKECCFGVPYVGLLGEAWLTSKSGLLFEWNLGLFSSISSE